MESVYKPYFDPDFETLIERIHPPRICIDNDTCEDCTLVKVDSPNRHGILLEMVQVLTDLDLLISKAYISSDGEWFMDVFHVTDQMKKKLADESLILYIQQSLCGGRKSGPGEEQKCLGRWVGPRRVSAEYTALEMATTDSPGLLSEVSAVLTALKCHVVAAEAWTHNNCAACIMYIFDETTGRPIVDQERLGQIEEQLESVVGAHCGCSGGEGRMRVSLSRPSASRINTERRLHQLMITNLDYDEEEEEVGRKRKSGVQVSIEMWQEKGYSIVSVKSRDRPKLLFDTVCTLTDMKYMVFHAAISSRGSMAVQEYYVRHVDGFTLDTEYERRKVTRCLISAVERRVSHGLKLDVSTRDRPGLLADATRVLRENGLSIARVELATRGERAMGTFYVKDVSGNDVDPKTVESVRREIGATVLQVNNTPSGGQTEGEEEVRPRLSLGSLLWGHLERLSNNFGLIRS